MVELLPEQVSKDWDFLWPLVLRSLPPTSSYKSSLSKLLFLQAIQLERAIVWGYYKDDKLSGLVVTTELIDPIYKDLKSMLIYSVISIDSIELRDWKKGIDTLRDYARSKGYGFINGFATGEQYLNLLKRLGIKVEYQLVEIEV